MKKKVNTVFLLLICSQIIVAQTVNLNTDWQFRQAGTEKWFPATAPGQVHTDLLENQLIDDPFIYANYKKVQWIGFKDWEYRTEFDIDKNILEKEKIELVFPGLDTYADVYLNDFMILTADNMFRNWRVDAKNYLKKGKNTLRITFKSVYKVDLPKYMDAPFELKAWQNNDQSDIFLSLYARKAGYHYGWDWSARFLSCGVWKMPFVDAWNKLKIVGVHIFTEKIQKNDAFLRAIFEVESTENQNNTNFKIENKNNIFVNKTFDLKKGFNKIEIDFNVKNAKIWWTNGIGEQPLYNFQCSVNEQHTTITTGIRTVEIIRQKDEAGQSMSVRLNGKDIFMKGANWIPLDNFINRVTPEKYEHFIRSAADANMNMLRVWGGGIYENNIFYQLCDSSGILVWQDMMFACGMFPADEKYLQTVENEVIDNVRRLRNHPCIALWNGNNENEISYYQWGWRTNMTPQHDDIYQGNLQKLFYNLIPAAIQSVDPSRYYHPTSPVTGYNKIGYNMGDVHLWSVWKGAEVEDYLKNTGRFMSEYGFQSYPDMFTIKKFSSPRDWTLDSPVMLAHQRAKDDETGDPHFGNRMMSGYMEKYFTVPADFQDFVYMSQFQQAEIVKVAMESHRRSKPYCMGTLFWQLNDCWQAASWASIDYYGRWKALQYYAKKAYADILVSPYYDDNKLKIKVISDLLTNTKANLQVTAMTVNGKIIFDKTIPLNISPNSAEDIFQENLAAIFNDIPENQCFVLTTLKQGDKEISSNIYYHLYANKYLYSNDLPEIKISKNNDGFSIMLISKTLIRGVYLYTENENDVFSDNYFTLIPNKSLIINVLSNSTESDLKKQIKLKSYNNSILQK